MRRNITVDDEGYICIPVIIRGRYCYNYEISPQQAGAGPDYWLDHLREKNWFTSDMERELREVFNQIA